MRDCPRCGNPIANSAVACNGCGWQDRAAKRTDGADPDWWRCCDVFQGQRCAKPGALSDSTKGHGPWYCADHYPEFRGRLAGKVPPPAGFKALRNVLPRDIDPEEIAERAAIMSQ